MSKSEFRFFERLRVRWAEIDAQKIVFNGHYLMYFDTAVASYWRALALPYAQSMELLNGDLYVRKATLEYQGSARYDDMLDIGLRCTRVGNSSILFSAAAFRRNELLVACELVYVFADAQSQTAKPVPQPLRDLLQAFEAGQPVLDMRIGAWPELGRDAQALRAEVFVAEQGLSADLACDADDSAGVHAVAYNKLGMALATGRLLSAATGVGRIGRMATRQTLRNSGVGRALLDALVQVAKQRGDRQVLLAAHLDAAALYRRAGFAPCAPIQEASGVAQVEMSLAL